MIVGEIEIYDKETNNLLVKEKIITKLGTGFFNRKIEHDLVGRNENSEISLEYDINSNPFGKRKPELIRLVKISEFRKRGINPIPGLIVNINGFPAIILSVSSGRVLVDFNNPLAGKNIKVIIKNIRKPEKKEWIKELANYLGLSKFVEEKEGKLIITNEFLKATLKKLGVTL